MDINEIKKEIISKVFTLCIEQKIRDIDAISEKIEEEIHNQSICGYVASMNFLLDEDRSLKKSVGVAYELGYQMDGLNSELLANCLLHSLLLDEKIDMLKKIVEDIIDTL